MRSEEITFSTVVTVTEVYKYTKKQSPTTQIITFIYFFTCDLVDTFIQSDLQLIRLD